MRPKGRKGHEDQRQGLLGLLVGAEFHDLAVGLVEVNHGVRLQFIGCRGINELVGIVAAHLHQGSNF